MNGQRFFLKEAVKVCPRVLHFLKESVFAHIALMLDNAPSYLSALFSDNGLIIVEFLPLSVTARMQPEDQGVKALRK